MDFSYAEAFPGPTADAYERLIHEAMIGDPTLFIRTDEVEQCWRIVDPIVAHWEGSQDRIPLYEAASWGPAEGEQLLARDGRAWHNG